jgi:type IV secretion system protein VirB10
VQDATGSGLTGILGNGEEKQKKAVSADPNSAFEANVLNANTKAERVEATRIGDLRRTIAQGRLIQATMESALNTDMPAPIRAVVSRDTYGEAGTEPLIPKGSRLIGTYNTDISGGQSRVFVVWTRVIRPDGVDIELGSPLVDQIGQAGVGGQVDTKFQQVFSRSVLSSVVSIAFAIGSDKISGGSTTTTSSAVGGSSTTGDASTTATVNALNRLGSLTDSFIEKFIDVRPTILVDQGTQVNVFVNRDLVFPAELVSGTRIVN